LESPVYWNFWFVAVRWKTDLLSAARLFGLKKTVLGRRVLRFFLTLSVPMSLKYP